MNLCKLYKYEKLAFYSIYIFNVMYRYINISPEIDIIDMFDIFAITKKVPPSILRSFWAF